MYIYSANDPLNRLDPDGNAATTAHGGVNYFRNMHLHWNKDGGGVWNGMEVAVNTVGGTVSDVLSLDAIADNLAIAGDSSYSGRDRVHAAGKTVAVVAFDVVGGAIVKRVVSGVGRLLGGVSKRVSDGAKVAYDRLASGRGPVIAESVAGDVATSEAAGAATKIDNAAKAVEDFLGGEGKIIKNADGDTILMRGDKKIRFDIKDAHGDTPHFHLGPEHRYYFTEEY